MTFSILTKFFNNGIIRIFNMTKKAIQFVSIRPGAGTAVLRNKATKLLGFTFNYHIYTCRFIKEHNGHKNFITSFVGNSLLYYFCCMWGIRLAMHKVQLNRQNPDHFHNKSSLSFHPDLCARQWFHNLSKPYIQNV